MSLMQRVIQVLTGDWAFRPVSRQRTYFEELGWRQTLNGFEGYYFAHGLRWQGRAERTFPRGFSLSIKDPPIGYIRNSPWSGCFHSLGNGWWAVNVHGLENRPVNDINSGIAAIENVLNKTFTPGMRH